MHKPARKTQKQCQCSHLTAPHSPGDAVTATAGAEGRGGQFQVPRASATNVPNDVVHLLSNCAINDVRSLLVYLSALVSNKPHS